MGLFDVFKSSKDKGKKEKKEEFRSIVIESENVSKDIQDIAQKHSINASKLDFELLSYKTYIKKDQNSPDWIEVNEGEWNDYNKQEIVLDQNFLVKQVYEINVVKYKEARWSRDLFLHINVDKNKCVVSCTIRAKSLLIQVDDLFDKLKMLIHKQMIRSNILIDLWDVDYDEVLHDLCAKVYLEKRYEVAEDIEFEVSICYPPIEPVDSELILHFEQENDEESNERIDYRKRGYLLPVKKDDILIEFIKAKAGVPGRNCKGEFIEVREPRELDSPDFGFSENIEKVEDTARILYKSKRDGYISFKDNRYDILDEMQVKKVSFKETGSIEAGAETNVKVHIHENDVAKEAVGEGLEVEAEKVNIEGNIASSSKVVGEEVFIGGQTHKTSKVYAKRAKINVLRGYIRADEVEIKRLEGGIVDAKNAKIEQAIGGEIRAINITIEKLGANVKFYASNLIKIGNILGENNKFIIDVKKILSYKKELTDLENKKNEIEEKMTKISERIEKLIDIKNKSEPSIKALKKKIAQDNEKGIKSQNSFVIKIRQFQQLIDNIDKKQNEYKKLENEMKPVDMGLSKFQNMIINAKIINKGAWKDFTEVEYRLLEPLEKVTYHPKAGEKNQEIYLKKIDDDFYEIATKKVTKK